MSGLHGMALTKMIGSLFCGGVVLLFGSFMESNGYFLKIVYDLIMKKFIAIALSFLIASVITGYLIYKKAYPNNKLTCNHYILNSYLYILLSILLMVIFVILLSNHLSPSLYFIYGGGFELTSGKFAISPSFSWTESPSLKTSGGDTYNGNDTMTFSIPVSYSYSNNIDITASFNAVNNDDFINASTSAEKVVSESTSWGIGIDYKF